MEYDTNTMARAKMTNVVVSPKDSREVSAALRGKSIAAGLALLAEVKEKKRAIRYTRYNQESAGHRTSVSGPGRYPLKAAIAFEQLLGSARSNAEFKDLDPDFLRIVHVKADQAATPFRYGRHRGRQGKRAHIEIIVQEDERLKKTEAQSVSATKQKAVSKKSTKRTTKADAQPEKASVEKGAQKSASEVDAKPAPKSTPKADANAEEKAAPKVETDAKSVSADDATPARKTDEKADTKGEKQ
jgi:ribosomal protein uL22